MRHSLHTVRTALYVPGDRPDRFDKAVESGADVVILDLEDAVRPEHKVEARSNVTWWLRARELRPGAVQVRVNAVGTPWHDDDLAMLPADVDLRVPKVESAAELSAFAGRQLHALVESALGVERAFEIASHDDVQTLGVGEADLRADTGVTSEAGLDVLRVRIVVAARAAGLPAPMASVFADIADLEGLARSCAQARALGYWGRAAVHPSQLPVIDRAFEVTDDELAWATRVIDAVEAAGGGVATLAGGAMVDDAMARRAREVRARVADG